MEARAALRAVGLTKFFHMKPVVDGVDLVVERGEILGFLGPNGAGKTTVMNMVMGLLAPDGGEIELLGARGGMDLRKARLRVGYLQEKPRVYPEMTARAYLTFFAQLYGVPDPHRQVRAALERVGLADAADRVVGTFSRGMQQRVCLARVMLHGPEILILDEPTLGLDPSGVADMREILCAMRAEGMTLFFSSHQLAEMERICDRVAIMRAGRIVAAGRLADLLPDDGGRGMIRVELHEPVQPIVAAVKALEGVVDVREAGPHRLLVRQEVTTDPRDARAALSRRLTGLGLTVLAVEDTTPSLEDLFLALVDKKPVGHNGAAPWTSATTESAVWSRPRQAASDSPSRARWPWKALRSS